MDSLDSVATVFFFSCHGCAVQLVDSFHCSVFEMVLQRVVRVLNVVVSNLN